MAIIELSVLVKKPNTQAFKWLHVAPQACYCKFDLCENVCLWGGDHYTHLIIYITHYQGTMSERAGTSSRPTNISEVSFDGHRPQFTPTHHSRLHNHCHHHLHISYQTTKSTPSLSQPPSTTNVTFQLLLGQSMPPFYP